MIGYASTAKPLPAYHHKFIPHFCDDHPGIFDEAGVADEFYQFVVIEDLVSGVVVGLLGALDFVVAYPIHHCDVTDAQDALDFAVFYAFYV